MGVLDFLRDAIQPAVAARSGYLAGQSAEVDKQRAQAIQDAALKRQSLLDQIKAQVDQSTIDRNDAQATRDARAPVAPKVHYTPQKAADGTIQMINDSDPHDVQEARGEDGNPIIAAKTPEAPHTITTTKGILQYDPDTGKYVPTGFMPPPRASDSTQELGKAKTALDIIKDGMPRPSKVAKTIPPTSSELQTALADPKNGGKDVAALKTELSKPNPAYTAAVTDSTTYDRNQYQPARQRVLDLTGASKTTASPVAAAAPSKPMIDPKQSAAMQSEFDASSTNLNAVLNSSAPKAVKDQARALYDQQQSSIAKKYGVTTGSQP
jgi:hypothetical protein